MTQENIPWESISAYLKGEEGKVQMNNLREWLTESDENSIILKEIISTWQLTRKTSDFYEPNKELLWKKLVFRIGYRPEKKVFSISSLKYFVAAAVVVLVFITGVWMGKAITNINTAIVYTSVKAPSGSKSQIILPDSTTVWLNSGAEIRYPTSFEKKSRDVFISGECYFDVTKDPKRQFIVHCADFNIKVFGTSFNVRESKKHNQTEISLIEGKVQVLNTANSSLAMLTPGEQFIYAGKSGIVKKIDNIDALTAWKNNMLIFENSPFEDVIQSLESWYGVDFQVDSEILNKHNYTFKVKTESLKEVLELISIITPIDYVIEGEYVNIKYK